MGSRSHLLAGEGFHSGSLQDPSLEQEAWNPHPHRFAWGDRRPLAEGLMVIRVKGHHGTDGFEGCYASWGQSLPEPAAGCQQILRRQRFALLLDEMVLGEQLGQGCGQGCQQFFHLGRQVVLESAGFFPALALELGLRLAELLVGEVEVEAEALQLALGG